MKLIYNGTQAVQSDKNTFVGRHFILHPLKRDVLRPKFRDLGKFLTWFSGFSLNTKGFVKFFKLSLEIYVYQRIRFDTVF